MSTAPNDDNTTRYASKTRVERIPLTYYYKNDPVDKTKLALTVVAILGFGAWAAFGLVADPKQHSPGPVASVHAMWNTQCSACHTNFRPTSGDAYALFGNQEQLALFGPDSRHGAVQCTQCHAGGAHHANLKGEEQACASCHREHRGLDAKLTLVADANCTFCHRELSSHAADATKLATQKPLANTAIRSFVDGHPEFRSLAQPDRGRLKFSHSRHMALGQKLAAGDKERAKTLGDLSSTDQEKYRNFANADGVIQLQCASCHETGSPQGAPPTLGDYMQPVNFERHCAACHQQTYAPVADAKLETMPHGLPPEQMLRAVKGEIVEQFLERRTKQQPAADADADPFGFPGKSKKEETAETAAYLAEHLPQAERMLRDRCLQCHVFPAGSKTTPLESPLVPTEVPSVWLKHANFDHRAHRSISCLGCHEQAGAKWKPGTPSLDHEQVMIAGYESCVKCHAPQVAGGTSGARFDCTACHRYHGADKPAGFFDRSFSGPTADAEWNLKWLLAPK